jgi:hypothetical protein
LTAFLTRLIEFTRSLFIPVILSIKKEINRNLNRRLPQSIKEEQKSQGISYEELTENSQGYCPREVPLEFYQNLRGKIEGMRRYALKKVTIKKTAEGVYPLAVWYLEPQLYMPSYLRLYK